MTQLQNIKLLILDDIGLKSYTLERLGTRRSHYDFEMVNYNVICEGIRPAKIPVRMLFIFLCGV